MPDILDRLKNIYKFFGLKYTFKFQIYIASHIIDR